MDIYIVSQIEYSITCKQGNVNKCKFGYCKIQT